MANNKIHRKLYGNSSRPILSLLVGLGFITTIFFAMMLAIPKENSYLDNENSGAKQSEKKVSEPASAQEDGKILAVVKAIDANNKKVNLFDVDGQKFLELSYNGGTNITDKYGKAISISQIGLGEMVDVTYLTDNKKLINMNISKKAWNYVGVNNMGINLSDKIIKIASTLYKYEEGVIVFDGGNQIPITDLAVQDELTVRGYEETIWSITVTKGHGTVILQDYQNFLGDYITIGYESMLQITEDMEITVREGNFNLTVENGNYNATKNITVNRNKVSYVSLSDLGPGAGKMGMVTFRITPFGADLYLDGDRMSYANPIELDYGKYKLVVSMGGYTTYEGILNVDSSGKTVKIELPESSRKEEATVSETVDSTTMDNSNSNNNEEENLDNTDNSNDSDNTTNPDSEEGDIDKDHKIFVQNPVGTSVYIDGKYKLVAPGSFPKMIGTHVITFIKEGYKTMSYTIEVSDDGVDSYYTFPDLVKE